MKNIFWLGSLAVLGVLATGFVKTGTSLQKLSGYPVKFKYVKQAGFFANLLTQIFKMDLAIENPNQKSMTFQQFYGSVWYQKKQIALVNVTNRIKLPGKETTILKGIEIKVSITQVGTALYNLLFNPQNTDTKKIQVKGYIKADGFKFPVNEEISAEM